MSSSVNVEIVTSSQVINYPFKSPGTPPKITLNGQTIPSPGQLNFPTGFQIVVFNSVMDITSPAAILANNYQFVVPYGDTSSWAQTIQYTYAGIVETILTAGNTNNQIIMLASFGLDLNMCPTNEALSTLLNYGANSKLQYWDTHADCGSQVGNSTSWTSFPASYIMIGGSGWGYGNGYETLLTSAGQATLTATLDAVTTGTALVNA
ncbi:MAG TPA: hypothetical protein VHE55_01855 [Fimbriimonadaceae bacterium]|nr:hypothetical protein [Fimbriimonadaceae bacterium]